MKTIAAALLLAPAALCGFGHAGVLPLQKTIYADIKLGIPTKPLAFGDIVHVQINAQGCEQLVQFRDNGTAKGEPTGMAYKLFAAVQDPVTKKSVLVDQSNAVSQPVLNITSAVPSPQTLDLFVAVTGSPPRAEEPPPGMLTLTQSSKCLAKSVRAERGMAPHDPSIPLVQRPGGDAVDLQLLGISVPAELAKTSEDAPNPASVVVLYPPNMLENKISVVGYGPQYDRCINSQVWYELQGVYTQGGGTKLCSASSSDNECGTVSLCEQPASLKSTDLIFSLKGLVGLAQFVGIFPAVTVDSAPSRSPVAPVPARGSLLEQVLRSTEMPDVSRFEYASLKYATELFNIQYQKPLSVTYSLDSQCNNTFTVVPAKGAEFDTQITVFLGDTVVAKSFVEQTPTATFSASVGSPTDLEAVVSIFGGAPWTAIANVTMYWQAKGSCVNDDSALLRANSRPAGKVIRQTGQMPSSSSDPTVGATRLAGVSFGGAYTVDATAAPRETTQIALLSPRVQDDTTVNITQMSQGAVSCPATGKLPFFKFANVTANRGATCLCTAGPADAPACSQVTGCKLNKDMASFEANAFMQGVQEAGTAVGLSWDARV